MNKKRNILIFVFAIVLVVVIIGLPSMKFVQKLSAGCPLNQNKSILSCNPCISHTMASQMETGDLIMAALPSIPSCIVTLAIISQENVGQAPISTESLFPDTTPLRC